MAEIVWFGIGSIGLCAGMAVMVDLVAERAFRVDPAQRDQSTEEAHSGSPSFR